MVSIKNATQRNDLGNIDFRRAAVMLLMRARSPTESMRCLPIHYMFTPGCVLCTVHHVDSIIPVHACGNPLGPKKRGSSDIPAGSPTVVSLVMKLPKSITDVLRSNLLLT